MSGDLSLAGAILTVFFVLLLAYWCSRILGKNWMKASSGRNIKVIEQLQLGADKRILLVKLGDHVYLLGVSQAGIQMLSEVEGEFEEPSPQDINLENSAFSVLMKKYASLQQKRKEGDK